MAAFFLGGLAWGELAWGSAAELGASRELLAEAIGTGMITLLGCGTVAAAVFTGAHAGIWQIAATWGAAVALAA